MPRVITDFTKIRLTQAFEAKGNSGSNLIEDLQPAVIVHDLESGPFAPFDRWAWTSPLIAVAAQLPMVMMEPALLAGAELSEKTCIVDSVTVTSAALQVFEARLVSGFALATTQATAGVIPLDTRLGITQVSSEFILTQGANGAAPLAAGALFSVIVPINGTITIPLGVVWKRGNGTFNPQLVVFGSAVNTSPTITLNGRLFSVQS